MHNGVSLAILLVAAVALFFLALRGWLFVQPRLNWPLNVQIVVLALLYVAVMFGLTSLVRSQNKENFWDVSKYALCKGGPYMWQGDSETARMCRELAESPEGRCGIASYNCPTGYNGQPRTPFLYTPLSGDSWQNERCEDKPNCPCVDGGLCGMVKQTV